jgi:cell division septation protein DedD
MAINKNHEFEDLGGVKCAIAEKNASQERVDFLKRLLEYNGYTVIVVTSPPPKAAAKPAAVPPTGETTVTTPAAEVPPPPPPSTFTVGVTDVTSIPPMPFSAAAPHTRRTGSYARLLGAARSCCEG